MLWTMLLIREFEEMVVRLRTKTFVPFEGFQFRGATHLSVGQEAVAAGTTMTMTNEDLITSTHRGHGHSMAKGALAILRREDLAHSSIPDPKVRDSLGEHVYRMMAELLGKEDGYCRGRGGGMHIADFEVGNLGANAIVGGGAPIAVGAAIGSMKLGKRGVVYCFLGDGAINNGVVMESLNFASMAQFKKGIPIVFVVENNCYGMTGAAIGELTGLDYLARRAAGFRLDNLNAEVVDGTNVLAVYDAALRAKALAQKGQGPVFLECMTYRYYGHSLSDDGSAYRSAEEVAAWKGKDCLGRFINDICQINVLAEAEINEIKDAVAAMVEEATIRAAHASEPDPATLHEGLLAPAIQVSCPRPTVPPFRRNSKGQLTYRQAVIEALQEEMEINPRIVLYGEDVASYGGAFQATVGLLEKYGPDRVFNTPISEAAIIGTGVGMACVGLQPVVEIMYIDFLLQAMDQLANQACKIRYMFGGKTSVPLVVRTTIGGGKGYAGQHSQSLESIVTHFPGLKVVAPATAYDVKGLLKSAIRDPNPVVFIEHQLLYAQQDVVPTKEYLVPIGKGCVRRSGTDVTIAAYSYMTTVALQAAAELGRIGVSAEVVDLRTLVPLDEELLVESVRKTGRLLVVTQSTPVASFAEHIVTVVQKDAFDYLDHPIVLVASAEVPLPMASTLEQACLPNKDKIVAAASAMLGLS
jgi:2-oxoisovalerate dehydrogenase E1 component